MAAVGPRGALSGAMLDTVKSVQEIVNDLMHSIRGRKCRRRLLAPPLPAA
jgi:hypothetical protein